MMSEPEAFALIPSLQRNSQQQATEKDMVLDSLSRSTMVECHELGFRGHRGHFLGGGRRGRVCHGRWQ